ncbi:MAG TPA: hypothetical protein VHI13_19360 [Candidatus Kapabacteria bacterium]|nr:hypothetical protein [Candidatus Kapabacteria bacterium]
MIARIDSYTVPPDTTKKYDTTYGIARQTLFGAASSDSAGSFRWDKLLGISDSTLYLTSYVDAPAVAPGKYYWKIDLARHLATITRITDPLADGYLFGGIWVRPGLMVANATPTGTSNWAVARSLDNGRTWEAVQTSASVNLAQLKFTSPAYGISTTMYTTDTARTWHQWGAPFGVPVLFHAEDSLHLYATSQTGFFRSSDAGRTWDSLIRSTFDGIWAGAGMMLAMKGSEGLTRTVDSGASWQPVAITPDLLQMGPVAEVDPRNHPGKLYAIARFRHSAFDSVSAYVGALRSDDFGASWSIAESTPQFESNIWAVPDFAGVQLQLRPLLTFVPNVGREGSSAFLFAQDSLLYRSTDGGTIWERTGDTKLTGYSMANEKIGLGARDGEILRTEDGGATWTHVATLPPTQWRALAMKMFDTLECTAILPDVPGGYASGSVVHSHDGGRTWTSRRSSGTGGGNLRGAFYWIDRSHVYCTWAGQVLRSNDSGHAFSAVHPPLSGSFISSGFFDGRYIYYTRNTLDTVAIGRWRVDEGISSVAAPDAGHLADVRCRIEGSPAEVVNVEFNAVAGRQWDVALVDTRGDEVARRHVDGDRSARFDVRLLASGRYTVLVHCAGNIARVPILLAK